MRKDDPVKALRILGAAFVAAAVLLPATTASPAAANSFSAGSPGLGDPFFPLAGNGGYDVGHYTLRLDYRPATKVLTGSATISARATQNLDRFDVDLRGFTISRLEVNGRSAAFSRSGQELIITPKSRLRAGQSFTVRVDYAGVPEVVTDPDDSIEGWVPTPDGAFVVNEPQGSPGWYPANDNPRDKATYDFAVTVPQGLTVMANGVLVDRATVAGRSTFWWRESRPMAPYLATATLGRFDLTQSTVDGVPSYVAVDPTLTNRAVLAKLPSIVDFYSSIYGRYPFDAVGAIVDNAPDVGYALETQTKPNFDRMPSESTLAHELSHQWYGDAVTLARWPDIWLHEGFATWASWLWGEHTGGETTAQIFDELYATPATNLDFWSPPPAVPGQPDLLFTGSVYVRGGLTLEALRQKIGDAAFYQTLRDWISEHAGGNATTPEFIALAERDSGQDLAHFFDVWLYQPEKPVSW
jgi:aminopeptidase N